MQGPSRSISRRAPWSVVPLTFALVLLATGLPAQPPAAPIPIDQLSAEQYESLPDAQVIRSGDEQTTLGDIRAREAARREALGERIEAARAAAERRLVELEAELDRTRAEAAREEIAEVRSLTRHLDRQAAANRQAVRRARDLSQRRSEARALWIRANGPANDQDRKRMRKEYERILEPVEEPGG